MSAKKGKTGESAPSVTLESLRREVSDLNLQLLDLLNRRAAAVQRIGEVKQEAGMRTFDPVRESAMLEAILKKNRGPFPDEVITTLFKEIFKASAWHMDDVAREVAKTSRKYRKRDTVVRVGGVKPHLRG